MGVNRIEFIFVFDPDPTPEDWFLDRCKRPLRSNEIAYQMVALGAPGM